jgi:hypothetical protein
VSSGRVWLGRCGSFAIATLLLCAPAATAAAPPFSQCPAVYKDTSCQYLITATDKGGLTLASDPSQGPYEGSDDALVGVQNDSTKPLSSVMLGTAGDGSFAFDGDGLCNPGGNPVPAGCPFGATGYEGPGTSFTVTDADKGTVTFKPAIAPGGSSYFSLEANAPPALPPFVVIHPSNLDTAANVNPRDTGALDFANERIGGTTAPESLTITNGGKGALHVTDVSAPTGAGFTKVSDSCTGQAVQPGDSCAVAVRFSPAPGALDEHSGELIIADDAPDSPQYVSLRGTGTIGTRLPAVVAQDQGTRYGTAPCKGHREWFQSVGWGLIDHSVHALAGQVVEGHVATEDFTGDLANVPPYHTNADENFFVYPDQGYRGLLNRPGSFLTGGEFSESEAGRIEVEWERAGGTGPEHGGLPEWAWPTVGDKVRTVGWLILDCGHGNPQFRSEIHPPLATATYRNAALSPFATTSGRLGSSDPNTHQPATRVDFFTSTYAGPAFGVEFDHLGQWWQPAYAYRYQFDVSAPPKPNADATLAPPEVLVRRRDGNPTLDATPLANGRGYRFTVHFAGGVPQRLLSYGASIWVGWNDPSAQPPDVTTYVVTPEALTVLHRLTGLWSLYAYVNEEQFGSLISGDGENSNHERIRKVHNGEVIGLRTGRSFEVTLVKGQPLHVEFRVSSVKKFGLFGDGISGGTAATFAPALGDDTLTGEPTLGDPTLGRDEWSQGCPCYRVRFNVRKL